jgi:hypothetical protein
MAQLDGSTPMDEINASFALIIKTGERCSAIQREYYGSL